MQRRHFIRNSSITLGGLLLQNELMSSTAHFADDKINIGVIGVGSRGKGLLSVMMDLQDKFTITAVCDVLDFRFKEAKEEYKSETVKEYRDYRKLLDDQSIQAVVIATPLYLHFQMAADALKAGKHVYLEKTMTYSIPQAIELVKLSKMHNKQVLQVGHQLGYTPLYIRVKEMIEKGYLGKITQVDCRYDRHDDWRRQVPDPALEKAINWRMYKAYSGGLTAEILSHQMQFINWALGTHPDEVFSTGGIDFYKDGRETYDNVQIMLRYQKEGIVGNFGSTISNEREGFIFKIKGSKGTVELLLDQGLYYPEQETKKQLETVDGVAGATKIEWKKDGGIAILDEKTKEGTWFAFKDFHHCIAEKKRAQCDVVAGAKAAIVVHLANTALYTHTVQRWKPEYNFV
ncbi:MAG: Gfo/Idh/MocA family oxidoreductase [Flavitalea sp.]